MSNLFDKISTLVNAQVNDLLGRNPRSPLARIRLHEEAADKDPRRSAQSLRQRLEEAVAYEDELQAKVDGLTQEALALDQQVDALLRTGDDFGARRVQGQLNMKQQQLNIAESELRDHRLVTQHLMREMATLDSALDQYERQSRPSATTGSAQSGRQRIPIDGAASHREGAGKSLLNSVSDKLNETRESLEGLLDSAPARQPADAPSRYEKFDIVDEAPDPRRPKPHKKDAKEMKGRLSRLSKSDSKDE